MTNPPGLEEPHEPVSFSSDNATGVASEIMAAMVAANTGPAAAYGADAWTQRLEPMLTDLFEHAVAAFPIAVGTAANALALGTICPPFGAIYCHATSHINEHQCGAPELYTGGAKLLPLPGLHGKIDPRRFANAFLPTGPGEHHRVRPAALSVTQATERGTVYSAAEIGALAEAAHDRGLLVHMDGARFANALVHLGCSPAEASWKAGIDVLCLGATKNGALAAEIVVFFDPARAETFSYRRKRGGHLMSKMRFLSAQLVAYFENDLWLRHARHANTMATRLSAALANAEDVHMLERVDANMVFASLPTSVAQRVADAGYEIETWPVGGQLHARIVTAFDSRPEDVDGLAAVLAGS